MTQETVLYRVAQNVGIITLNRPERLNAITGDLLRDLIRQLNVAREDVSAASVILTGAGRSFCAGSDLKEIAKGKSLEQWQEEIRGLQDVERAALKLDKPLIGAIHGHAVGGGSEFAMACDIRIAAQDAVFGFPETKVGLTLSTGAAKLLAQIVGLGKAKELVFTADFIDAREALRIGFVNKVVPRENLMDEAMALACRLAEKSPLSLRLSRIALDEGLHSNFEEILDLEAEHLRACVASEAQREYVVRTLEQMRQKRV